MFLARLKHGDSYENDHRFPDYYAFRTAVLSR
jgi:hypothetical protein